jgi:hypothetical protein
MSKGCIYRPAKPCPYENRCAFLPDHSCTVLKDFEGEFTVICERKCPHYKDFVRQMDAEDERMDAEVEEIFRTGVWR